MDPTPRPPRNFPPFTVNSLTEVVCMVCFATIRSSKSQSLKEAQSRHDKECGRIRSLVPELPRGEAELLAVFLEPLADFIEEISEPRDLDWIRFCRDRLDEHAFELMKLGELLLLIGHLFTLTGAAHAAISHDQRTRPTTGLLRCFFAIARSQLQVVPLGGAAVIFGDGRNGTAALNHRLRRVACGQVEVPSSAAQTGSALLFISFFALRPMQSCGAGLRGHEPSAFRRLGVHVPGSSKQRSLCSSIRCGRPSRTVPSSASPHPRQVTLIRAPSKSEVRTDGRSSRAQSRS